MMGDPRGVGDTQDCSGMGVGAKKITDPRGRQGGRDARDGGTVGVGPGEGAPQEISRAGPGVGTL